MRIYLSSFLKESLLEYRKRFPNKELNILISYGTRNSSYYDLLTKERDKINSIILDSGAFTKNFAKGADIERKITLEGFAAYCRNFQGVFDYIFNYDENFTKEGFAQNLSNLERLKKDGIMTVPVIHDYTGDETDYYIEKQYPIVSLGFSPDKRNESIVLNLVNKLHQAKIKVHLLGVSSYKKLKKIPAEYCDSSSWTQAVKYGYIIYWNPMKAADDKTDKIYFRDKENGDKKLNRIYYDKYEHREELKLYLQDNLGITETDLYGIHKHFIRQLINIHYFVELQERIRQLRVETEIADKITLDKN